MPCVRAVAPSASMRAGRNLIMPPSLSGALFPGLPSLITSPCRRPGRLQKEWTCLLRGWGWCFPPSRGKSRSARRLADSLGVQTPPVVVSNACISGLAALLQGMRMIRSGAYDHVLVVGAELQSRFVVTGFQSLKALSQRPCRPFDAAREGLNLGEAAAAMLLSRHSGASALSGQGEESAWELVSGAIRNDANHISGPSRTGEGSYNALRCVMEGVKPEELAFVNVHGTATPYNDQMEAVALSRAGLETVPVNALKGVFGHTMGAAGILESLVSMLACERGVVLPTRGFSTMGVEPAVCVSARERETDKKAFVKLLSGFGGVNGALLFRKGGAA